MIVFFDSVAHCLCYCKDTNFKANHNLLGAQRPHRKDDGAHGIGAVTQHRQGEARPCGRHYWLYTQDGISGEQSVGIGTGDDGDYVYMRPNRICIASLSIQMIPR